VAAKLWFFSRLARAVEADDASNPHETISLTIERALDQRHTPRELLDTAPPIRIKQYRHDG